MKRIPAYNSLPGAVSQPEVLLLIAVSSHQRRFGPHIRIRADQPVVPVHADVGIRVEVVADTPLPGDRVVVGRDVDVLDAQPLVACRPHSRACPAARLPVRARVSGRSPKTSSYVRFSLTIRTTCLMSGEQRPVRAVCQRLEPVRLHHESGVRLQVRRARHGEHGDRPLPRLAGRNPAPRIRTRARGPGHSSRRPCRGRSPPASETRRPEDARAPASAAYRSPRPR